MRCPTLNHLPPPPSGKADWPWTEESPQLPDAMVDGGTWPRISIVTTSYNQGQFIEETIRSVLLQGYPNLEYIIIDGGSVDGSIEIIRKYEPWLAYWVSERDRGPVHAVNKGFEKATGEVITWVNSDDYFLPGAFRDVVSHWSRHGLALYYGRCQAVSEEGNLISQDIWLPPQNCTWKDILRGCAFPMTSIFFPRKVLDENVQVDEKIELVNDWEFCLRLLETLPSRYIEKHLSSFRIHSSQRTAGVCAQQVEGHLEVLRGLLCKQDLSMSDKLHVVSAIGHYMITNSYILLAGGTRFKAIITGLFGYILDFQQWKGRLCKLACNPFILISKIRSILQLRPSRRKQVGRS